MANSIITGALTRRTGIKPRLRKAWVRRAGDDGEIHEVSEWTLANGKDLSFAEMTEATVYIHYFNELLKRYQTGETWI